MFIEKHIIVLEDKNQAGKKRPWKKRKNQSLATSAAFSKLLDREYQKISHSLYSCGSYLKFESCPSGHFKKLHQANFCRNRDCVMCQWRRSLVMSCQLRQLGHAHLAKYKTDVPCLLTLTVPNCRTEQFQDYLKLLSDSFRKLFMREVVKKAVRSWFRAVEVTYNKEKSTYHPHFHVLLMLPCNYFSKSRNLYIPQSRWLEMWRESTGLPEITQVDIRKWKPKGKHPQNSMSSLAAEAGKYMVKPSSYLNPLPSGEYVADPNVLKTLHDALKKRRLIGFGGLFKKLRKELKQSDIEQTNLVNIDEDEPTACLCKFCQTPLTEETYFFHLCLRNYVKKKTFKK